MPDFLFIQVTQLLNELLNNSKQSQNINHHQKIYFLVGIMSWCEVQLKLFLTLIGSNFVI